MSRYRPIDVRLWSDVRFLSLSERGKLFWMFLLTTPLSLPIPGVIIGGEAAIAEHLGWEVNLVREGLREVVERGLRVRKEGRVIWLSNALKYQPPAGPNVIKGWSKVWDEIPDGELKVQIWEAMKIACRSWSHLFAKLFPNPVGNGFAQVVMNQVMNPLGKGFHTGSGSETGTGSGSGSGEREQTLPLQFSGGENEPGKPEPEPATPEPPDSGPEPPADPPAIPPPAIATSPTPAISRAVEIVQANSWQRRREWWQFMLAVHRRIRDRGIKPNTPDLPKSPAGVNERNLALCERSLREAGSSDEEVDAKMRHVVLIAEAEAVREDHLDWFKPALIWDPVRFNRAVDTTLPEATGETRRARSRSVSAIGSAKPRTDHPLSTTLQNIGDML